MTNVKTIQYIEFLDQHQPMYCLFCGQRVVGASGGVDQGGGGRVTPCAHTLFVATDEGGFAYYAPRVAPWAADTALGEDADAEEDAEELSVGERVRQIAIRNAVCIEFFQPMPSGVAAYIGFAPVVS